MSILKTVFLALPIAVFTPLVAVAADDAFATHFISEWDLDTDGKITLAEVTERRGSVFLSFDANEDGELDGEEQALMGEMRDTQHGEMGGQGMAKDQGHGAGMGHAQKQVEAGMHQGRMFDTDGDGRWTRDEFVGFSAKWHARMDSDGDSVITKADF